MNPAAKMSDVYALFNAARPDDAIALTRRLADAGDGEALFILGDLYWRGTGVPQDQRRARELFQASSDAGNPVGVRAWTNLLASGIGGTPDWEQGLRRLRDEARTDTLRARMVELIEAMELTATGDPKRLPKPQRLSEAPDVVLVPGLFSPAECLHLLTSAEPGYQRALIHGVDGDFADPVRTAEGSTMHWLIEDPAIHALNRRIAAASGTSYEQGEPLLILRYQPGQEYRAHVDALPGEPNQRGTTVLVWLNQGYGGGETAFTKTGLKVRGNKGDALIFRNTRADGRPDPLAEHAGLPVTAGAKYLASRWIRLGRFLP